MSTVDVPVGTTTQALGAAVTCPICGGDLAWVNGRTTVTDSNVGTESLALLRCPRHGEFEVRCTLRRADVLLHRPSGAQQRRAHRLTGLGAHS
jgi:hypothetical protein